MVSPAGRKWEKVRNYALGLPEAWEDHPWGEVVAKVGKKIFVFLGMPDSDPVRVCVKLTDSHHHAMSIQGAEPAGARGTCTGGPYRGMGRGELPQRRAQEADRTTARLTRRVALGWPSDR